jgi:hypothetical protein
MSATEHSEQETLAELRVEVRRLREQQEQLRDALKSNGHPNGQPVIEKPAESKPPDAKPEQEKKPEQPKPAFKDRARARSFANIRWPFQLAQCCSRR